MRSINMIRTLNVDVLGVVENFAGPIFGSGAGEDLARDMDLPFLGRLDLREDYRDTLPPYRAQQRDRAGGVPRNRLPNQGRAGQRPPQRRSSPEAGFSAPALTSRRRLL